MIKRIVATILLCFVAVNARAALTIDITEVLEGAIPIAVVPFAWQGKGRPAAEIDAIISADLKRSGKFQPLSSQDMISRPHEGQQVNFSDWRTLQVEFLVIGKMQQNKDGKFQIQFQLFDVAKAAQMTGYSITSKREDLRQTAHQISDIIFESLTGIRGAFDTRIAYVTVTGEGKENKTYRLAVADADGYNEQIILSSPQPIMSPSWSPDGRRLAYVSFSRGRPEIYIQNIFTRKTQRVASYKGLNNAPVWSPDGKRLALTLSKDGNPEIYILEISSRTLHRVTRNYAIDTEPAWMPDGSALVFTSDRGGSPQLYMISVNRRGASGRAQRLTYEGNYNARASISPDAKFIAMVHRKDGGFRIAVLELDTDYFNILTDARLDESPSFSPNGSMIIYATEARYRGVLAAVSVDGRSHQRFSLNRGDVREPAWSPFKPK